MIQSFQDKETQRLWNNGFSRKIPQEIQRTAFRKLVMIHRSKNLDDLRVPPGNRLERLRGARKGQFSVRINDQWRICFSWNDGHAYLVEIIDYH